MKSNQAEQDEIGPPGATTSEDQPIRGDEPDAAPVKRILTRPSANVPGRPPLSGGLFAALAAREAIYSTEDDPSDRPLAPAAASDHDTVASPVESGGLHLVENRSTSPVEIVVPDGPLAASLTTPAAPQPCAECEHRERRIVALEAELRELFDSAKPEPAGPSSEEFALLEVKYHRLLDESDSERRRNAEEFARLNVRLVEAQKLVEQAKLTKSPERAPGPDSAVDRSAELARLESKYKALMAEHEKDRRAHNQEIASLSEHLSQARNQADKLRQEIEKVRAGSGNSPNTSAPALEAPHRNAGRPVASDLSPAPLVPTGSGTTMRTVPTPAAAAAGTTSGLEIVILDDSDVGQETIGRLSKFRLQIGCLPANTDVTSFAGGPETIYVAANLAMASTWAAIRQLRTAEQTRSLPIVAYALAPRSDIGFWFGHVEFALFPSGAQDLLDIMRRVGPGMKQVIGIGSDNELMQAVSRGLARDRVRVTIALDRRQGLESVRRVYPEVAIIYPTGNPVDAFRAIAGIREIAAFRELPTMFLLDDEAKEKEDEKLSGGVRTILRLGGLEPDRLADLLPAALNQIRGSGRALKR